VEDIAETQRIIYLCTESLRVCAILLQPFMPDKMSLLLDMLGVESLSPKRNFNVARIGADPDYGVPKVDLGRGQEGVLFPRLASDV
jgi:methionyl-tRNA synthetase